jgi:hypothetical protein
LFERGDLLPQRGQQPDQPQQSLAQRLGHAVGLGQLGDELLDVLRPGGDGDAELCHMAAPCVDQRVSAC